MTAFVSIESRDMLEAEMPWTSRALPTTVYQALTTTRDRFGGRNAVSFQITSGPGAKAETVTWHQLHQRTTQAANLFRSLGVGENDVVAYLLPNCNETVFALLGGMTAGIVNPINPLLDVEQIAGILNETKARILVTLKGFPKTDVAQKAAEAVAFAPGVKAVLEVDLLHYLSPPKSWIVPLLRPKVDVHHHAKVLDFNVEMTRQPGGRLTFAETGTDRVAAYFHTGGTTGAPKVAQHKFSGMLYNGWLGQELMFDETDVLICPLPLFHCFACYPILMSTIQAGAHVVLPTPAGYRGDGVFDNFWKLIERWNVSFLITVPTALAALMQRPVDADVSSLKTAISGSAPLPLELYRRFEQATGVQIAEGYGLTEATCLVSCNPMEGEKKVGSVGIPLPYTDVRILHCEEDGTVSYECKTDEVGEICIANPGVFEGSTYTEAGKNLVRTCNQLGIMIDMSHLNEKGFWDIAELSTAPLVATHSNVHALCQTPRNLTDRQLDAIKESRGMVGLNYAVAFLREDGKSDADTPIARMVDHLAYMVDRMGETSVGLGSDFDGAMIPNEIGDASGLPRLIDAMKARGFGDELVDRIAYGNWLDLLERTIG